MGDICATQFPTDIRHAEFGIKKSPKAQEAAQVTIGIEDLNLPAIKQALSRYSLFTYLAVDFGVIKLSINPSTGKLLEGQDVVDWDWWLEMNYPEEDIQWTTDF